MMTTTDHEPTLTALDALTTLQDLAERISSLEQALHAGPLDRCEVLTLAADARTVLAAINGMEQTILTAAIEVLVGVLEQVGPDERLDLAVFTDGSGSVAVVPEALPRTPSPVTLDTPSDLAAWVDGLRLPDGAHRMQEAA